MQLKHLSFVLIALISVARSASAWSSAGHMVIAAGAYRDLSPKLQEKVTACLKAHPEYETWAKAYSSGPSNIDFPTYIFLRSSTWPDEIRRRSNDYDHPHWHYINYPLKPSRFSFAPGPTPDDDILYGISQCEKVLSDKRAPAELHAADLSWLVHLIGDLHQPLHCATLINATYSPPAGDKGGNDFYIKPAREGIRLHSFWDQLLGRSANPHTAYNEAIRLEAELPRKSLHELSKAKTPVKWSLESRTLAIEKVYLDGRLAGSPSSETAPALPEDYAKAAKSVAERRAALAAARLADEIRKYLK
jgi:hypothetical protein